MLNLLLFPLRWLAGLRVFRCRECWGPVKSKARLNKDGTLKLIYGRIGYCSVCNTTGRVGLSVWWSQRKSHV